MIPLSNWGTDHVTAILDLEQKNSPASKAIGFAQVLNLFLAPILSGKSLLFVVTYFRSDSIWSDPFLKLKISKKLILPSYDTRWFLFKVINFEATHYQDSAKESGKKNPGPKFPGRVARLVAEPCSLPKMTDFLSLFLRSDRDSYLVILSLIDISKPIQWFSMDQFSTWLSVEE